MTDPSRRGGKDQAAAATKDGAQSPGGDTVSIGLQARVSAYSSMCRGGYG
jgi:hypothetical protein